MEPHLLNCPTEKWLESVTVEITSEIGKCVKRCGHCSLVLTGGSTAESLYDFWAINKSLDYSYIHFFIGDERCVEVNSSGSNYGMIARTLFSKTDSSGLVMNRMEAETDDREDAALRYEGLLPDSVDILLLGLGTDGHIASIFPYSEAVQEKFRTVLVVDGPDPFKKRLSITPSVIKKAKIVFLLATGTEKGEVLATALADPNNIDSMPVRLILDARWLLDEKAAIPVLAAINKHRLKNDNRIRIT